MTNKFADIKFNRANGRFSGGTAYEKSGLILMQLAAFATSQIEHKGMSLLIKTLRRLIPSSSKIYTEIYPDAHFAFPYGDPYWSSLFDTTKIYGPEFEPLLLSIKDEDYCFIDCGANYGYVSTLVTSAVFGKKAAIAIEPHPETFRHLQYNAKQNNGRFDLVNKAVFSSSGNFVSMKGNKHEARSIVDRDGHTQLGSIETVALDDLLPWVEQSGSSKTILKLDVEGAEIDALTGAQALLQRELLVLYECHGSDSKHKVSEYLMNTIGMEIFFWTEKGLVRFSDLAELNKFKAFGHIGYDFFATKSLAWLEILEKRLSDQTVVSTSRNFLTAFG